MIGRRCSKSSSPSHLSTHDHAHVHDRLVLLARPGRLHLLDHILTLHHPAKDHMLAVQKRRRGTGDEKLTPIRVGAAVGHGEQEGDVVLVGEVLIREGGVVVDARRACAVPVKEVAALDHEGLDHAVELGALVALRPAEGRLVLAGAELPEVLGRARDGGGVEEEFDAPEGFTW